MNQIYSRSLEKMEIIDPQMITTCTDAGEHHQVIFMERPLGKQETTPIARIAYEGANFDKAEEIHQKLWSECNKTITSMMITPNILSILDHQITS